MKFCDLPEEYSNYEKSKIVILPVPYDKTCTWIKGACNGPEAIIQASANLELYDIETDSEPFELGIYTDLPIDADLTPEGMVSSVYKRVSDHLIEEKFTIVIGGEHTVSVGSVKAHAEKYKDLTVLQLDAHSDLRNVYNGSKYNHACTMARIKEICPIIQVGIRSMDSSEKPKNV